MKRRQIVEVKNALSGIQDKKKLELIVSGILEIIKNESSRLENAIKGINPDEVLNRKDIQAKFDALGTQLSDLDANNTIVHKEIEKTAKKGLVMSFENSEDIKSLKSDISDLDDKVASIKSGEDGKTPKKGEDYFTQSEILEFTRNVTIEVLKNIKIDKKKDEITIEQLQKQIEDAIVEKLKGIKTGLTREEVINLILTYRKGARITQNITGGSSVWGSITGDILNQTDLIEYIASFDYLTQGEADLLYQPLEDQRLSTTDDVAFASITLVNAEGEGIGVFSWDSVNGTPQVTLKNSSVLQLGQEMFFYGKATENILNGDAVQFAGVQGDHILIKKAVGSELDLNPQYFVGVATQNIATNEYGYVTWFGKVNNVYTKTPNNNDSVDWLAGDILYINISTGYLTNSEPAEPHRRIRVASVIKEQTGASETGVLIVRPDIGVKLQDLNDVDGSNPTATGDLLTYNLATGIWERGVYNINDYLLETDFTDANISTSDITTNNATTLKHGFLPKLSGNANQYLNGQGNYSTISGSSTPSGYTSVSFSGQTSVNVVHNFGIKPVVQVMDNSGSPLVLIPLTIAHNTDNDFTVTFDESTTGTIIASAGSPQVPNVLTINADYTILTNDNIIIANTGRITITLPTAVGVTGKTYSIDNASGDYVTLTGTSGQTIWGETSQIIPNNSTMVVYSTGTNWRVT